MYRPDLAAIAWAFLLSMGAFTGTILLANWLFAP